MTNIVHADDSNFAQTLAGATGRKVLVDFYAPWCGPCKAMGPALEAFAAANPDVLVVKVDVDAAPETAMGARVRSVPTLEVFIDGQSKARGSGAMNGAQLQALVQRAG